MTWTGAMARKTQRNTKWVPHLFISGPDTWYSIALGKNARVSLPSNLFSRIGMLFSGTSNSSTCHGGSRPGGGGGLWLFPSKYSSPSPAILGFLIFPPPPLLEKYHFYHMLLQEKYNVPRAHSCLTSSGNTSQGWFH